MNWMDFSTYAIVVLISWLLASGLQLLGRRHKWAQGVSLFAALFGIGLMMLFMVVLWVKLERPPMRTLGETRLWYALLLPSVGMITFYRWRYRWFLVYALLMGCLFVLINYFHPENFDKTLMPALISPWFVPHVIVYMFAYALLGVASVVAVAELYAVYFKKTAKDLLAIADNLVYIGFAFLTLGLLFGALWAKEAWGHYWTWDPKETWALLTWMGYLIYIHLRHAHPKKVKVALWILSLSFVVLMMCWFGINYLPSAQNSVHTYSR